MIEDEGPPVIPMGAGTTAPPKRVEDREPRQKNVTGSEVAIPVEVKPIKKTLHLKVSRKKEKTNETKI